MLNSEIAARTCDAAEVQIFIAGPFEECERACALWFAERGGCVSIDRTRYVYTGGREDGCVVRFINYPRFPKTADDLAHEAELLARHLMIAMGQGSCTVSTTGGDARWLTRRSQD